MTPLLYIQLFGKATIQDRDQNIVNLPAKAQELFFYLLLNGVNHNQYHERETLCALLWADHCPDRAKKYLRQALWQLQSTLNCPDGSQSSLLEMDGNWVHVNPNADVWLDAEQLIRTYTLARDTSVPDLQPEQVAKMQEAVGFYRGDLLTGWYQDWCILERERFQSMVLSLLDRLIEYAIHHGYHADGIDYARQILQIDSARERTHRALMRLHFLANNRSAALRQFESCTQALTRELNVKPSKRTLALYEQIRADELDHQTVDQIHQTTPWAKAHQQPQPQSTLTQIRDMLSAMVSDISDIKEAMEL